MALLRQLRKMLSNAIISSIQQQHEIKNQYLVNSSQFLFMIFHLFIIHIPIIHKKLLEIYTVLIDAYAARFFTV